MNLYNYINRLMVLMILFFCLELITTAQGNIGLSVLGNGGDTMTGHDKKVTGTIGQTIIGTADSSASKLRVGFWYTLGSTVTSVEPESDNILVAYNLFQNFPNPFNPTTIIKFTLPKKSSVKLKVYNSLGEEVVRLINEEKGPGNYQVVFDASSLASGAYFYRIVAGAFSTTKKMLFIK